MASIEGRVSNIEGRLDSLATREDLAGLRGELMAAMSELKAEIRGDLLRTALGFAALQLAGLAAVAAIVKLVG